MKKEKVSKKQVKSKVDINDNGNKINVIEQNKIFNEVEKIIRKIKKFVKENGDIDKVAVRNAVSNLDVDLIDELLKNKIIKKEYFNQVSNTLVFNQNKFIDLFDSVRFLGDSYTKYKADIGLIDANEKFIVDNDDVVLSFPFKDCLLEFDSTDVDDKRDEYFINERIAKDRIDVMLEPKVFVNCKKIDKNGESKKPNCEKFDIEKDNLLIKGNNLLAMYSLFPRYENKIKLMYWDILYNTKDDEVPYADSFKHSSWLVMMKNRLEVAKKLLKDDGVICIQCDDTEMAYLKVLMDEIFGRNNFVDLIINQSANSVFGKRAASKNKTIVKIKDYILIYSLYPIDKLVPLYTKSNKPIYDSHEFFIINGKKIKTTDYFENKYKDEFAKYDMKVTKNNIIKLLNIDENLYQKVLNEIKDIFFEAVACDKVLPNQIEKRLKNGNIVDYEGVKYCREDNGSGGLRFLRSLSESCYVTDDYESLYAKADILGDVWNTSSAYQNISNEGKITLKGGKKPELIIKNLLKIFTNKHDIVLDAYFGTGTTGAVAMKMGRRFIGIEQLDDHFENKAKVRLKNVIAGDETGISKNPDVNWKGGGSFISMELAKLNDNFIEEINKIDKKNEKKLFDVYKRIIKNPYLNCYVDVNKLDEQTKKFEKLSFAEKKKILIQLLDKNQLYVNYMDMNDKEFKISDMDKKFTNDFYNGKE